MRSPKARPLIAVLALASLPLIAACTSTSTSSTGTPASGGATTVGTRGESRATAETGATDATGSRATGTTAGGAGTNVTVRLSEWGFAPSASSAAAGTITFTAQNTGKDVHELVLFKTELDPANLPLDEEGAVDERAAGIELVDEVEDVQPGASKSFTVENVAPGKYVLVCNTVEKGEKHYQHKMYSAFNVT